MKLIGFLALIVLSACAVQKVAEPTAPAPQLIQEKEGSEETLLMVTVKVFNYAPNSATLEAKDHEELTRIISEVSKNQKRYKRIEIVGHSDLTGSGDLNLDLSKERAISILEMMKAAGIDRKKIRTSWLAGTEPVENVKESFVNRRVEIKFFEKKKTL